MASRLLPWLPWSKNCRGQLDCCNWPEGHYWPAESFLTWLLRLPIREVSFWLQDVPIASSHLSVQACMVYSNKKIYWSGTPVNLFPCQSCKFCNICSCDCRYIITDSRNSNGLYEETSFVVWLPYLHFELLCLHFLLFTTNFRYRNGNILPFQTRLSAVSIRIKLICAPESRSIFPHLQSPPYPLMSAVITGSRASWLSVTKDMLTRRSVLLCNNWRWYHEHWTPFSFSVHCFLRLRFEILWSLPTRLRQLKQVWLSFTALRRSSAFRAANFWHWSG